jgi:hypothetical protein
MQFSVHRFNLRFVRLGLLILSFSFGMSGAELKIDHVTVAGADLKALQRNLQAVGLRSEYGGPHSNHATQMALVSFPDGSYLELIAAQDRPDSQALAAHYWSPEIRKNAGPTAWAVRVSNTQAEVQRLQVSGIKVTAPTRAGRARPDGVRLDWETANVGPEPNGTFFPFLIHDFTPRENRAFPSGKPTTSDFTGVSKTIIAVRDLDAAVARYRQAYGLPEPLRQADAAISARLAAFSATPVVLAAGTDAGSPVSRRVAEFGEGPFAFILQVRNPQSYSAAAQSNWFGSELYWFDSAKLGWRMGFER